MLRVVWRSVRGGAADYKAERRGLSPLEAPDDPWTPDGLESQPTQSRLIETLAMKPNRAVLQDALFESARRHVFARPEGRPQGVTLDIDSKAFQVYGYQKGSAYNGHYWSVNPETIGSSSS